MLIMLVFLGKVISVLLHLLQKVTRFYKSVWVKGCMLVFDKKITYSIVNLLFGLAAGKSADRTTERQKKSRKIGRPNDGKAKKIPQNRPIV
jgi:hypothetical protein